MKFKVSILLFMFFSVISISIAQHSSFDKQLKLMLSNHPQYDQKVTNFLNYYLDTCSLKGNLSKEEFIMQTPQNKTKGISLILNDFRSESNVVYITGTYSTGSFTNLEDFKENLKTHLDRINSCPNQKGKTLKFGYVIHHTDNATSHLLIVISN